jgi:hypothetical protein
MTANFSGQLAQRTARLRGLARAALAEITPGRRATRRRSGRAVTPASAARPRVTSKDARHDSSARPGGHLPPTAGAPSPENVLPDQQLWGYEDETGVHRPLI